MAGRRVWFFLGVLALGTAARADTSVVEVEEPVVVENAFVEETRVAHDPVQVQLTLPGERRVVSVRSFAVTRAPRVVRVTRPEVVVQEVRSFAEPVVTFGTAVEESLIEHDLRSFAPVVVHERHHHHDDDDDDDDDD